MFINLILSKNESRLFNETILFFFVYFGGYVLYDWLLFVIFYLTKK